MSEEHFRQPGRHGWKCEYWGGKMRLQPRHSVAVVPCETALRPVAVPDGFSLRPAVPEDPASFLAVAPTRRNIAEAALLVTDVDGPKIDLLFVRPQWQRRGLTTALTQSAMNGLDEPTLDRAHDVANDASGEWHRRFGFAELPGLARAKEEANCARWELRRRDKEGTPSPAERRTLAARAAHWKREVATLEAIAERDRWEAVSPILRRGRARKWLKELRP